MKRQSKMGSSASSSTYEPQSVRVSTVDQRRTTQAPSRERARFQEVQLREDDGRQSQRSRNRAEASGSRSSRTQTRTEADLSTLVGQMQREKTQAKLKREKTKVQEFSQPKYENNDDLVLETFYHASGAQYSCFYQAGQRFYMDSWQTQDWRPFPKHWYKEGILVTESVIKSDQGQQNSQAQQNNQSAERTASSTPNQPDDREGFIDHPERGQLATYIFEERRNVHYFFDKKSGMWVKLPLSWELRSELVERLLLQIEDALPDWKDKQDMLAALRISNYDPHDCINTYLTIGQEGSMSVPHNTDDYALVMEKNETIEDLAQQLKSCQKQLEKAQRELNEERQGRKVAQTMVKDLQEQLSQAEAEAYASAARVESLQRERPKTSRPKTPQVVTQVVEKETVDPESVRTAHVCMKAVRKEYMKLRKEVTQMFEDFRGTARQLDEAVKQVVAVDSGQAKELEDVREMYRREALQRKLLYNKLQELRGNIRVFCRCRYDNRAPCALQFPTDREVLPPGVKKGYKFDRVFVPQTTQEEVFEEVKPIITSCVDGYNVCILAYGQTGSGKTYTMMGPPKDPGVNIRAIMELLTLCQERDNINYSLKAAMVEIYNETIQDLLTSETKVLEVRSQGNKIHLPGMTEMLIESVDDVKNIMSLGDKNRHVASTKMNSESSRSHLLLLLTVEGRNRTSGAVTTGTLTMCDLAGSERVSKTDAQGQRLVEAAAINKSLSSLGQVFNALRNGQLHVPYRNSKLTHILQPSLGGDAKAAMFVNISPAESNLQETGSTLLFGSNARQVQLGEAKRNVTQSTPRP